MGVKRNQTLKNVVRRVARPLISLAHLQSGCLVLRAVCEGRELRTTAPGFAHATRTLKGNLLPPDEKAVASARGVQKRKSVITSAGDGRRNCGAGRGAVTLVVQASLPPLQKTQERGHPFPDWERKRHKVGHPPEANLNVGYFHRESTKIYGSRTTAIQQLPRSHHIRH